MVVHDPVNVKVPFLMANTKVWYQINGGLLINMEGLLKTKTCGLSICLSHGVHFGMSPLHEGNSSTNDRSTIPIAVEPRLTTTLLIQTPQYSVHFFWA